MKDWNELVKWSMLGTEKAAFLPEYLPLSVQAYQQNTEASDPEARFLQTAAFLLAYRRAGTQAATTPVPRLAPANVETLPYTQQQANLILRKLLDEDVQRNTGLIALWLHQCAAKQCIVPPEFLPDLLDLKSSFDHLPAFPQVLGQRGQWLAQQREKWALKNTDSAEIWQSGSTTERNELIQTLWKRDPALALHYIQAAWPSANSRERLAWAQGLSNLHSDIALKFAEEVHQSLSNGGTRGKESSVQLLALVAAYLLTQPDSALYQKVCPKLQSLVQISKGFLGLKAKPSLQLPATVDAFFNEKNMADTFGLGTEKGKSAEQIKVWFAQILAHVHPRCWEEVLGNDWHLIFSCFVPIYHLPLAEALARARRHDAIREFSALPLTAAIREELLTDLRKKALLFNAHSPYARLRPALELLPQDEQEQFIRKLDSNQLAYFYQAFPEPESGQWSLKTTQVLFTEMRNANKEQNGFQNFMLKQAWPHLHLGILPDMIKVINGTSGYGPEASIVYNYIRPLHQQLTVRQSIIQAFNN